MSGDGAACGAGYNTQAHELAKLLGLRYVVFRKATQIRDRKSGLLLDYGNAILSRYELHSVDTVPLPPGSLTTDDGKRMPGAKEPRVAVVATVSPVTGNPEFNFTVLSIHLGIYNSAESDEKNISATARAGDAARLIAAFFKENPARQNDRALLMGDFNSDRRGLALKEMERSGWLVASGTKGYTTFKKGKGGKEIDFICSRRCDGLLDSLRVRSWEETNEASDHLPVIADLHFNTFLTTAIPFEKRVRIYTSAEQHWVLDVNAADKTRKSIITWRPLRNLPTNQTWKIQLKQKTGGGANHQNGGGGGGGDAGLSPLAYECYIISMMQPLLPPQGNQNLIPCLSVDDRGNLVVCDYDAISTSEQVWVLTPRVGVGVGVGGYSICHKSTGLFLEFSISSSAPSSTYRVNLRAGFGEKNRIWFIDA